MLVGFLNHFICEKVSFMLNPFYVFGLFLQSPENLKKIENIKNRKLKKGKNGKHKKNVLKYEQEIF